MYNHNKAQQSKKPCAYFWDILYIKADVSTNQFKWQPSLVEQTPSRLDHVKWQRLEVQDTQLLVKCIRWANIYLSTANASVKLVQKVKGYVPGLIIF